MQEAKRKKYKTLQSVADANGVDVRTMLTSAFQKHATIRSVAQALGISYTSIQWWLATNGLEVQQVGHLVPRHTAMEAK